MESRSIVQFVVALLCVSMMGTALLADREFNGSYSGRHLDRVAFPIGGMGAGMFCLEGQGAISHMSVRHRMEFFHQPSCYAALTLAETGKPEKTARVLEGPVPDWKIFGAANGWRDY